ncbi:hypothetical protein [Actinomadura rugatobispora]|uniref:Uncharacterized protein n=1 Tax=Actinomadura rugatobispora TaxID=1994 RepID=A0ABW1A5A3_9ACTN|nr:hypothetical protein GCM10010200_106190 [Actinomadura rugatobispora]
MRPRAHRRAVIAVVDRCQELIRTGVAASAIENLDYSPLVRAREDARTAADVHDRRDTLLRRLEGLP